MKKKKEEHVNHERWLVSYADFVTLLFAFFVVMYAISQADLEKLKKVTESMKEAFGAPAPTGMVDVGGTGGDTANPLDPVTEPETRVIDLPAGKTVTSGDPDPSLKEIKEKLEESVSLEVGGADLSQKLKLAFEGEGLLVRIATKDLFDAESAEVAFDLRPLLDKIGQVLGKRKKVIVRIEGHADRGEANPKKFPSAWELSAARAAWVAQYWIRRFEINPQRIGIAGYSFFRPVSEGKSEWERGANRRVEILILSQKDKNTK